MIARLATALLLADIRLSEWLSMPAKTQSTFAAAHGIGITDLIAANRAFGQYLVAQAGVDSEHRRRALDALYGTRAALPNDGGAHGEL